MNITVYLGSSMGNDPAFKACAEEVGSWIAADGHTLIYGGSQVGLMGVLADAALRGGAQVIGVEPQFFLDEGYDHPGITKTIPTETMAERRTLMLEMGDVYLAIPGGVGTLDEISEAIAMAALDKHAKPCILYNLNGYYDPLREMFDRMAACELLIPEGRARIHFASSVDEIRRIIAENA